MRLTMSYRARAAIIVCLTVGHTASAFAKDSPKHTEIARTAISQVDLAATLKKGASVTHRTIAAEALSSLLALTQMSEGSCGHALVIEDSIIVGDLDLRPSSSKSFVAGVNHGTSDPTEGGKISTPIVIVKTKVQGSINLSNVRLNCPLDLSGSTIEGDFVALNVKFERAVTAVETSFNGPVSIIDAEWKAPINFAKARFHGFLDISNDDKSRRGTFGKDVNFEGAIFERYAHFIKMDFVSVANFRYARFLNEALFQDVSMRNGPTSGSANNGPFYQAEFMGRAGFSRAKFNKLRLVKTVFRGRAEFDAVHADYLEFDRTSLSGPLDMSKAEIGDLQFQGPMSLEDDTMFRDAQLGQVIFFRVRFLKGADFQDAHIASVVKFLSSSAKGNVTFEEAQFGAGEHSALNYEGYTLVIKDMDFGAGLLLEPEHVWLQTSFFADEYPPRIIGGNDDSDNQDVLNTKPKDLLVTERRLWRQLERAFKASGAVDLENFATYRVRLLGKAGENGLTRITDFISHWSWGYGLRPIRIAMWFLVLVITCALPYGTQLKRSGDIPLWLLIRTALIFSFQVAWKLDFGYVHTRTLAFRVLAVSESIIGKVLITLCVYALSNTSPLLNDLARRLIPDL